MKITTPKEMGADFSEVEDAIQKFEEKFKEEEKGNNYYHLVIIGELDKAVRIEVAKRYMDAGWSGVSCITSSQKGERPGLTELSLERKIN